MAKRGRGSRRGSRGKGLPKTETRRRTEHAYWFEKEWNTRSQTYRAWTSYDAAMQAKLIAEDHVDHVEMWYLKELKKCFSAVSSHS